MRSNYQAGRYCYNMYCSRVRCFRDHCFLADHGIKAQFILSRALGDNRGDAEMKRAKLYRAIR